jgi:hypothetical protein
LYVTLFDTRAHIHDVLLCRNSVHTLLEAMRNMLDNIHVAEVPAEAGDEASDDDAHPG